MNEKIEKKLLKQLERITRKNAVNPGGEPPWPICTVIFHQPKRPKA